MDEELAYTWKAQFSEEEQRRINVARQYVKQFKSSGKKPNLDLALISKLVDLVEERENRDAERGGY